MRVAAALLQAAATYMRPEEVRLAGARGGLALQAAALGPMHQPQTAAPRAYPTCAP